MPRLIVAGSSSSIPRPDRACSSYLVDDGETPIVLDLGTGAFSRLRRHVDYDRLGAVVISHMHADHFIDLIPLRYALRYGGRPRATKLPVYLPPGGLAMLRALVSAFPQEGGDFLGDVFELAEYEPSRRSAHRRSDADVRAHAALHPCVRDALGARRSGRDVLGRHRAVGCRDRARARVRRVPVRGDASPW